MKSLGHKKTSIALLLFFLQTFCYAYGKAEINSNKYTVLYQVEKADKSGHPVTETLGLSTAIQSLTELRREIQELESQHSVTHKEIIIAVPKGLSRYQIALIRNYYLKKLNLNGNTSIRNVEIYIEEHNTYPIIQEYEEEAARLEKTGQLAEARQLRDRIKILKNFTPEIFFKNWKNAAHSHTFDHIVMGRAIGGALVAGTFIYTLFSKFTPAEVFSIEFYQNFKTIGALLSTAAGELAQYICFRERKKWTEYKQKSLALIPGLGEFLKTPQALNLATGNGTINGLVAIIMQKILVISGNNEHINWKAVGLTILLGLFVETVSDHGALKLRDHKTKYSSPRFSHYFQQVLATLCKATYMITGVSPENISPATLYVYGSLTGLAGVVPLLKTKWNKAARKIHPEEAKQYGRLKIVIIPNTLSNTEVEELAYQENLPIFIDKEKDPKAELKERISLSANCNEKLTSRARKLFATALLP